MKIIYRTETGISIVHPTGEIPIEQVLLKDVPQQYQDTAIIVDDSVIPTDRTFRDAWKLKNKSIVENLEKSKEITKNRLRKEREPLLTNLDVEYMKALETNSDTTAIIEEKQRLRDITKLADSAKTTTALKSLKVI